MRKEPLTLEHINAIAREFDGAPFTNQQTAEELVEKNGAIAYVSDDGTVLGILGVIDVHPGVCQVWAAYTELWKRRPRSILTETRKLLATLLGPGKYHRVEFTTEADASDLSRWAISLGATAEGVLRGRGSDGKDHVMWSITVGDLYGNRDDLNSYGIGSRGGLELRRSPTG